MKSLLLLHSLLATASPQPAPTRKVFSPGHEAFLIGIGKDHSVDIIIDGEARDALNEIIENDAKEKEQEAIDVSTKQFLINQATTLRDSTVALIEGAREYQEYLQDENFSEIHASDIDNPEDAAKDLEAGIRDLISTASNLSLLIKNIGEDDETEDDPEGLVGNVGEKGIEGQDGQAPRS